MNLIASIGAGVLLVAATAASASVSIGGYTFDDNAFVDSLDASTGNYITSGGPLATVVTDVDPGTWAGSFDANASLTLSFVDNVAVNGAGNDIVLFELGVPDGWNVTINGITLGGLSANTGFSAGGFNLNALAIDLSDFGIAANGTVSSLSVTFISGGATTSTSLVGALNSASVGGAVPEPATWAMLIAGFGLVGAAVRRRAAVAA